MLVLATSINIYLKYEGEGGRQAVLYVICRACVCVCVDVGVCNGLVAASVPPWRAILSRVTVRPSSVYVDAFLGGFARVNIHHPWKKTTCIYVY